MRARWTTALFATSRRRAEIFASCRCPNKRLGERGRLLQAGFGCGEAAQEAAMKRSKLGVVLWLGVLLLGMAVAQAQQRTPPGRDGGDPPPGQPSQPGQPPQPGQPSQPGPSSGVLLRIKPEQTAELLKQAKYADVRVLEPTKDMQRVTGKI